MAPNQLSGDRTTCVVSARDLASLFGRRVRVANLLTFPTFVGYAGSMQPKALENNSILRLMGEALAIVLSILLAFAIDAWWQDRAEYREETRALRALRDEFEVNRQLLAKFVAFHSDLRSSALAILQLAADPTAEIATEEMDRMIVDVAWWGSFFSFESAALDAVILGAKLDLLNNEALRRMLADWRGQLASASAQNTQEFEHYFGVLMPILRPRANLAQISNASLNVPGNFFDDPGVILPIPAGRVDHRALISDREFQNAVVEKAWIEDDMLRQYGILEPKIEKLLETLNSEIAGRED